MILGLIPLCTISEKTEIYGLCLEQEWTTRKSFVEVSLRMADRWKGTDTQKSEIKK